jgi:DNA-binding transcriptional regulator YiaG
MELNNLEIRNLRQRLGWSLAEMARQMGCTTALIQAWEGGSSHPDHEAMNQLHFLMDRVEKKNNHLAETPVLEREIESRGVLQLTHRDLLKDFQ